MAHQKHFVYMLTNDDRHTVVYLGVTKDLERRGSERSLGYRSQFARQDDAHKLIYFEAYPNSASAIAHEKQLKNWSRSKKEAFIARSNPCWRDLMTEMNATCAIGGSR
ncbi:MAG: GIY-YIG nuclease family protein [Chthoniobacterales bacterium]